MAYQMQNNNIEIYVANLAAYNAGILKGAWFSLPMPMEEIFFTIFDEDERDNKGNPHGDWAIHDYVAPFRIEETDDIESLNEMAERFENLSEDEIKTVGEMYDRGVAVSLMDAADKIEDCIFHPDCHDMGDVAYETHQETGLLGNIPEHFQFYIDWEKLGRDMEIEGTFFELDSGMIVEVVE